MVTIGYVSFILAHRLTSRLNTGSIIRGATRIPSIVPPFIIFSLPAGLATVFSLGPSGIKNFSAPRTNLLITTTMIAANPPRGSQHILIIRFKDDVAIFDIAHAPSFQPLDYTRVSKATIPAKLLSPGKCTPKILLHMC